MPYIDQTKILQKTNGGIDIITRLFPEAEKALQKSGHFKIREEGTPSVSLKRMEDGTWIATDWGDGSKRNGIQLYQHVKGISYKDALEQIGLQFQVLPEEQLKEARKPDYEKRPAKPKEGDGTYIYEMLKLTPKAWLDVLGPFANVEMMARYHWRPVKSYSLVKNREVLTWSSREDYPIFIIEEEGFKKIYQPLNYDKRYRFSYDATEKPKDFIHGLAQAEEAFYKKNPHEADGYSETAEAAKQKEENDGYETEKLPEIIICSGDRDALNVAGMGYYIVWKNSESAKITGKTWKRLRKIASKVYNLPDIDNTGVREGHSLAMFYLDIYTIWLPTDLLKRKDWRGNPRKDLLDFCETYRDRSKAKFKDLMKVACSYKFWEYQPLSNGSYKYDVNNVHLYNFLSRNGFHRYASEGVQGKYIYIQIKGNVVAEVLPIEMKAYINNFLYERREDLKLRNHFFRSPHVNASSMENLTTTDPDFVAYSKNNRHFFFQDKVVEVTKEGIRFCKAGSVDKFVWEDNVIDHQIKLPIDKDKKQIKSFEVQWVVDENGRQQINDIEIKDDSCLFLRFMIQTSRMFWFKDLESSLESKSPEERTKYRKENHFKIDGPNLSADEIHEQKMHLVNKMYTIGYILHRYKQMSRAWVAYGMDNRISDSGESYGGSGKSIFYHKAIGKMCRLFYKGARDNKIFDDKHIFGGVTKHTDLILLDDAGEYLNFDFLFPYITGDFNVRPMQNVGFAIPFENSPIIAVTTNYTLRDTSPSVLRRILFNVFSDIYHKEGDVYKSDMNPAIDFGKELFGSEFTEDDWNKFYSTMLQCLQLYLELVEKVDPPMSNVELRNLRSQMGDTFFNWAEVYFSPKGEKLNQELIKAQVMEEFIKDTNTSPRYVTPQLFKKKLRNFAKYSGLLFNPDADGKRIIKKIESRAVEMIILKQSDAPEEFINDLIPNKDELADF